MVRIRTIREIRSWLFRLFVSVFQRFPQELPIRRRQNQVLVLSNLRLR
jgi:hypothetical protein